MRRGPLIRLALLTLVVLGVAAGGGYLWRRTHPAGNDVRIGGAFTLTDQQGRKVTERDLTGKPTAMFFGFTYCPEVCPTTLAALTAWMKAMGPAADRLNVVFVTVDPERDTPRQLALYLSSFDPRIRGFTGSAAEIARIAREYHVFYEKVPLAGGGYTMDHSSAIYLMDAHGGFTGVISYQEPSARAIAKLRALTGP
jgi:protein SCO1